MERKTQDPRIVSKVLEMVASHYKTSPDSLMDDNGDRTARQVVMYVLKDELGTTLRTSREAVNVKADMTVYTASKSVKELLKNDQALAEKIEQIKTEVLMLAASAPLPSQQLGRAVQPEAKVAETTEKPDGVIGNVQKAVTSVFLGPDLLRSADPGKDVTLAKDVILFLLWSDFQEPMEKVLENFHIANQDDFFRAIGRITVSQREDVELKKKLRAARNLYASP